REASAILDKEGRIVVYLAGRPHNDKSWEATAACASQELKEAAEACGEDYKPAQLKHSRGKYPVMHAGYTHGGGPMVRGVEVQFKAVCKLTESKPFNRIAGFASSAFRMAAPRLFGHYALALSDIRRGQPHLKRPFANSIFPTATFNLGPQAVTLPHRDAANVPYGWCAITALGDFDPKLGGHLYLWELKMVIEFPPGSTILVPSAVITHGNTPIQNGETRQSFTQYCAGSLLRWHTYGLRSARTLAAEDLQLKERLAEAAPHRWRQALELLSKLEELPGDHDALAAATSSCSS
ncbi:hypothetical protein BV25DRAFT_1803659, partial [Artomyces pyxidatus]